MAEPANDPVDARQEPVIEARRLLFYITGSSAAAFVPAWLSWLCLGHPDLTCKVILTRSAQRFVTAEALRPLGPDEIVTDEWSDEARARSMHVELGQWPDAVVVYPASMHFLARFALGMVDTPGLMAAQCTSAPIAIAPALPPGGWDSAAAAQHRRSLAERTNVVLIPPVRGLSMTTGQQNGNQVAPLPRVLKQLEQLRRAAAG